MRATLQTDFKRSGDDRPARLAVRLFRFSQLAPGPIAKVATWLLRLLCGLDMPRSVSAGPGLRLAHGARGSVIHPNTGIGANVTIYHGTTFGVDSKGGNAAPVLEDGVYVGAGACVLGGVTVGKGARVGANAVVLADVPAGRTAVGVPARIV